MRILIKKFIQSLSLRIGFFKTWIAGGMAGVCFWLVMFPVDAVKSRVQVFKPTLNFPKYTLEIIRNEGKSIRTSRQLEILHFM